MYRHIGLETTWLRMADKKTTNGSGCNKSEIDLCVMGKVDRKFIEDVKVITGRLQHNLVVVDVDKKRRKKMWKPKGQKT